MTNIEKLLKSNINALGPISLEEYMNIVLYHPKNGYYSKKNIIGNAGDFITAPEISQVFGELIASWLIYNAPQLFRNKFNYLELGPGKGTLCKDILRTIETIDKKLYSNIENIYFFEKSKEFIRQNKNIPKVKLISNLNKIQNQKNFIIANEFFDAIPVNQYVKRGKHWFEKKISIDKKNKLIFTLSDRPVLKNIPFPKTEKENCVFEYSHYVHIMLINIFNTINNFGGAFVIIDYAKEIKQYESTLSCIFKHKHVNPFYLPGETDLSTKPDFGFIKTLAEKNNCMVLGPFSQRFFLKKLGIEERTKQLVLANPNIKNSLLSQKNRLIGKKYMGDTFKVLIIKNKKNIDYIFENE